MPIFMYCNVHDQIERFLKRVVYLIFCDLLRDGFWLFPIFRGTEMLEEVSRREKEAGIYPEPEVDAFMKVSDYFGQES